jgi:hypothetical protein
LDDLKSLGSSGISPLSQVSLKHQNVYHILTRLPLSWQGGIGDQRRVVRAVFRQTLPGLGGVRGQWKNWPALQKELLALASLEVARQMTADGMAKVRLAEYISPAVGGAIVLADIQIAQGRLHEAMTTYERALQ